MSMVQYSFLGLVSFLGDAYCLRPQTTLFFFGFILETIACQDQKKVLSCNFGHLQHYSVMIISTIEGPVSVTNHTLSGWTNKKVLIDSVSTLLCIIVQVHISLMGNTFIELILVV